MEQLEQTDDVFTWTTQKLWNAVKQIQQETNQYDKEIEKVKMGYLIQIPIWYITQEWYEMYPSTKRIKIYGHGKYEIKDFMEDLEQRETTMRNIILNEQQEDTTDSRT